jgi:DNA-binding response OmpR family regulator
MGDFITNTLEGDNESKRISCLVDTKYYDDILDIKMPKLDGFALCER